MTGIENSSLAGRHTETGGATVGALLPRRLPEMEGVTTGGTLVLGLGAGAAPTALGLGVPLLQEEETTAVTVLGPGHTNLVPRVATDNNQTPRVR